MIKTIQIETCPKCKSTNLVKNGTDYKGDQKYHCKSCDAYGTLHAQKGYTSVLQSYVFRTYLERASMRGIARIFGIARQTLAQWIAKFEGHFITV